VDLALCCVKVFGRARVRLLAIRRHDGGLVMPGRLFVCLIFR
jgi:hypothetical protein